MGRPQHYSLEIAQRCQRLIEQLNDRIGDDPRMVDEWGGPLRTTFLLAMSTPMIVLPMERLFKPIFGNAGVADDLQLDPALGDRVRATFDADRPFGDAAFFAPHSWALVDSIDRFPVGEAWPAAAFDALAARAALGAAAAAPAATMLKCLRNALAHGGVAYLDRNGRQTDQATSMLAFAAFRKPRATDKLRLLRISTDGFQHFLSAWSAWLADSGVNASLEQQGPGWFDNIDAPAKDDRDRTL